MYARYTEYLRDIMLNEHSRPHLDKALSTYPLYEPEKLYDLIPSREVLNKKLLNHWKYHEIGFETVGRFLDELEITMCEIMPRYNELFKTIEIMADIPNPFDNVDMVETFEQERTDSSSGNTESNQSGTTKAETENRGTSDGTSNGKSVRTDTPGVELGISTENIEGVNYATEASWTKDVSTGSTSSEGISESESSETGSTSSSSESSGRVKHTLTRKGQQGVTTFARDINEFRTSIMDVVEQIIDDPRVAELFMMVY